jgi:DNA repair protein RecN (Recombination protein N)
MKELGDRLIDIHSQHQTLMVNDNSFQLSIIDSYAGNGALINDYRITFNIYRKLQKEYNELKGKSDRNKADLEYHQYHLAQLEEAGLMNGEQDDLEKEQELLEHAEEIKLILSNITKLFSRDDISILSMIRDVKSSIGKISVYLPQELNIPVRINSVFIELDDLAKEIDRLEQNTEADPERLARINGRLDKVYALIQKHRVKNVGELIMKKEEIAGIIKSIVTSDERLDDLALTLRNLTASLTSAAEEISNKRNSFIPEIELMITDLLRQLGIPNARFKIILSRSKELTSTGCDFANFLFSANKRTDPEDIARIASGGELSRVMLSLKSMLTKNKNLPTIIFDEIDSGVSGEVADKVGQILSEMGKHMQVVNITHLPQIASRGTRHFHVYKEEKDDSTITRIKLLSPGERIQEVARLLSGSEITETAIRNAKELIKAGER